MAGNSRFSSTNGLKLFRLIVDGGGEICRKHLRTFYLENSLLKSDLSNRRQLLATLLSKKVIFADQWQLLFPPSGLEPDIETFDITLLITLLRNICNLTPPCQGWKTDPSPSDKSTAANLLRIKNHRNNIAHIANTRSVSSDEFETLWNEISNVFMELGMDISEINRLKDAPLDKESCEKLQHMVENVLARLKEVAELVEKANENSQEILELVKNDKKEIKLCEISVKVDDSLLIGKGILKRTPVYHGKLTKTGQHVAVKKMFSGIFDYKKALDLKALKHPNIIRCFAVEEKGDFLYLALELCDKTLVDSIEKGDFLNKVVPSRQDCLLQVTEAVEYLHNKRVCHGDIKPANILVTFADGAGIRRFVLADINISKKEPDKTFSSKNRVIGDIGWLPKESYQPYLEVDPSWDIFSLGCVFYYVLANMKHPFGDANNLEECQKNIQCGKVAVLKAEDFVKFSNLKSLISSMVDHSPDKRPCIGKVHEIIMRVFT